MSTARRPLLLRPAMCRSGLRISTSVVVWMSPAVTVAGPRTSRRRVTGSSESTRSTRSLKLRIRSVTSSFTPGRVVNSWRASSKRSWVTAAPGMEESRVRRRELPSVWPKPGSRGLMAKRCRLAISSSTASTVGRWMMSMRCVLASCAGGLCGWADRRSGAWLLRVELDDELLAHGDVDVLAQRQVADGDAEAVLPLLQPRGDLAVEGVHVVADHDHLAALGAEDHHVATAQPVAGDGHPLAVHQHVPVADELAGLGPAGAPAGTEGGVVEAQLEHAQQVLAGDAGLAGRLLVEVGELLLKQAVDAAGLLLLPQLDQVLRALAHAVPPVLARGVGPALDRALHRVALGALQVQLHLLPPAEPADRTGVASHASRPSAASWAGSRCGGSGSRP